MQFTLDKELTTKYIDAVVVISTYIHTHIEVPRWQNGAIASVAKADGVGEEH